MNWTLRDNGWAFGLGAAILSFPITLVLLAESGLSRGGFDGALAAFCGSFGMLVACRSAYGHTRASSYRLERVVGVAFISFGMAFALAALAFAVATTILGLVDGVSRGANPFASLDRIFFFFLVMELVTWGTALATLGVPILGLTVVWSWLYLTTLGPRSSSDKRQSILRDKTLDPDREIAVFVWCLLSVASTIAILIMKGLFS